MRIKAKGLPKDKHDFFMDMYSRLICTEDESSYYQALVKNEWPTDIMRKLGWERIT